MPGTGISKLAAHVCGNSSCCSFILQCLKEGSQQKEEKLKGTLPGHAVRRGSELQSEGKG